MWISGKGVFVITCYTRGHQEAIEAGRVVGLTGDIGDKCPDGVLYLCACLRVTHLVQTIKQDQALPML